MMHVIPIYQSSRHVIIMIVVLFVIQVNLASVWEKLSENIYKGLSTGIPHFTPFAAAATCALKTRPATSPEHHHGVAPRISSNSSEMSDGAMVYVKIKLTSKEM